MSTDSPACPRWSEGLQKRGTYYEGYVDDLDSVLEAHRRDTITSWGTRRSSKAQLTENKENVAPGDPDQHQVSLHELIMMATHYYTINMICWW